jgi:lactate permease
MDLVLAFLPVVAILMLMLPLRRSGAAAGWVAWLVAVGVAALGFGAGWDVLAYSQLKGLLISLYVVYIIWGALLFYRVTYEAGIVQAIGASIAAVASGRAEQALLLGWVFSSFLQGVGGFGVPVAIVAPLMVTLGFPALTAVVITSVGHSWAVTFGSLGASFHALIAATGRSGAQLAHWPAVLLGFACLACGAASLWTAGGRRQIKAGLGLLCVAGVTMAGVQYLCATSGVPSIASMSAGLAGLAAAFIWMRWRRGDRPSGDPAARRGISTGWALVPYGLLVLVVLAAQLEPVRGVLDSLVVRAHFPELRTSAGYATPAGEGRTLSLFGHTGALLMYASLLTFGLGRARGWYRAGAGTRILRSVIKQVAPSAFAIFPLVGMAAVMEHAGMMRVLADGIAAGAGQAFPLASPFLGALGAFLTGSNTSSNLVLASLQENAAVLAGLSPLLILGAQTAGASIGSAISPSKIVVGCSTLGADESRALRGSIPSILLVVASVAAVTVAASLLVSR